MQFVVCCAMVTKKVADCETNDFYKTRSLLVVETLLSACPLTLNPYILKLIPRCKILSVSVEDPAARCLQVNLKMRQISLSRCADVKVREVRVRVRK